MFSLEIINAINESAQREYDAARACVQPFCEPSQACEWAREHAHDTFTAFLADGRVIMVYPVASCSANGFTWHVYHSRRQRRIL